MNQFSIKKPSSIASVHYGLQKTGIRGIQDSRQIIDAKTKDMANNDKKTDHSLVFPTKTT